MEPLSMTKAEFMEKLRDHAFFEEWVRAFTAKPHDYDMAELGYTLVAHNAQLRAQVATLEAENTNLMTCQCEGCDESLEDDAYCVRCMTKLKAQLRNERENVASCHRVMAALEERVARQAMVLEADKVVIAGHLERCNELKAERDAQRAELVRALAQEEENLRLKDKAEARVGELEKLIHWLLGEGDLFPERPVSKYNNLYWWRSELRKRFDSIK